MRSVVCTLTTILAAGLMAAAPANVGTGPAKDDDGPAVQAQRGPAEVKRIPAEKPRPNPAARLRVTKPPQVTWPGPGTVQVRGVGAAHVTVRALDRSISRRAGVSGPVYAVDQGKGRLRLSYAGFADAYGGDWGARLRLVRLPACAIVTPEKPVCRTVTSLPSANDTQAKTVSADVVPGMVLAMEADEASAQGDYKATSMAPSSSWSIAASSGGFSWNYPLTTPKSPGGLDANVAVSYSSQAVDGHTTVTNNQPSWLGEGFDYQPGYLERRYKPCADDGHPDSGEQCWTFHNATIMLDGRSGQLVKIDDNTWKLPDDDGTKIQRLTGTPNGDENGEYWKLTTTDGTQYFFGLNRLPGWASGNEETESVWTHTVYGDDADEPCYRSSGFSYSHCDQAWRWNLDHVVDPRGNVISYFYDKEINHYAREGKTDVNGTPYVRGGYLTRIDYGQRDGQVYTTNAPVKVVFTTAERCLPGDGVDCDPEDLNESTARYWPDVPYDRICAANTKCKATQSSPAFFTTKRLTRIESQIRTGSGWSPVQAWKLDHSFYPSQDGGQTLWLDKIAQTGHWGSGPAISAPPVEFQPILLPNRIDQTNDNVGPLNRYRLHSIKNETGAQITASYRDPDCADGALPTPDSNPKRCYPVRWNPVGGAETNEVVDWFHKYVVDQVTQDDLVGGNPDMVTSYSYDTGAAWAKAKPDGITKDKYLTWSDWRGYGKITIRTGDGQATQTKAEHVYLRGMGGTVPDSTGKSYTDQDGLAGHELETIVYDGSKAVSKTINEPWRHVTRTQTEPWGTRESAFVRTETVRELTALPGGKWREAKSVTSYDTEWGRPIKVDDRGDVTKATDDRCTRTWYADNSSKHLHTYASRTQAVSVDCGTTPNLATQLISDERTSYDLQPWGAAPSAGVVTRSESVDTATSSTVSYLTKSETTQLDGYGRALAAKNTLGKVSYTEYTETTGLTTRIKTTNPLSHVTTTVQDPAYGVPTLIIDPNDTPEKYRRTELAYDALGRLTAVWRADRKRSSGATPNIKFGYALRKDKTTVVTTDTLRNDGSYQPSYELFDGLLRSRQTQRPGSNGWLITDTFHNGIGKIAKKNDAYLAAGGTPGDAPLAPVDGDGKVNGQSIYSHDGAGRTVTETFAVAGTAKWSETTSYEGDRVVVTPPAGGVKTAKVTDVRGNLTELHEADNVTRYSYTPAGALDTVTDPLGNKWNFDYDQRGQKTLAEDPDLGDVTYRYDAAGNVTAKTDARGETLSYKYDDLGRRIETWRGEIGTGTKLSATTYDQAAKGQLYSTIRYTPSGSYHVVREVLDELYRPLTTRYWIPGADVGSSDAWAKYAFTTEYNADGSARSVGSPAAGGLPAETVVTEYDGLLRPIKLTGSQPYVTATDYSDIDQRLKVTLSTGTPAKQTWLLWDYERGTGRLTRARIDREGVDVDDRDAKYRYDPAGNILSIADTPQGGPQDIQCFRHDYLRRLDQAWTTTSKAPAPVAVPPRRHVPELPTGAPTSPARTARGKAIPP
jgi:YD repeat-containing protein